MSDKYEVTIEESNEIYEDALLSSREDLERRGLARSVRPKTTSGQYFDGHLPTGIDKASLAEISEVMTMMTVFADYAQGLARAAKAEKDIAEEKLKFIKSKIRKSKVGPKSEQDDATITDIRFVSANAEYLAKLHSYEAITAREEAARRDIKTLSRLISTEQINTDSGKQAAVAQSAVKGRKRWR